MKMIKMVLVAFATVGAVQAQAVFEMPRNLIFQEGGNLKTAIAAGYGVSVDVKMTAEGKLDGVESILDMMNAGTRALVTWKTDDARSIDLFMSALRSRSFFEKDYIFVCEGPLANAVREAFIWPRYSSPCRRVRNAAEALDRHRRGEHPIVYRGDVIKLFREMQLLAAKEIPEDEELALVQAIGRPFLPEDAVCSTWAAVYAPLVQLDVAADAKWRALRSRAEYDAYRMALRDKMMAAIGPLPERTPLNFRTVRSFERSGYRIDHVIFESMPGLLVPANLFVPTSPEFKPPYPAVVASCGHGRKDSDIYLRGCVDLVKRGFVTLMFEPYEQGERVEYPDYNCCQAHNIIGLKAMLLGGSMAALRIWDGMRAIDCVEALDYVDATRIGYTGNSGGGTMTALMTAADLRLKATAPSCYLTNFGYLCRTMGPQDAEQNIFGQLSFGLNHTGYVLIPDTKVAITGRFNDMFDFGGTVQLMETVRTVSAMLGTSDHYALNFAQGPHGWTESTLQGTADWMCAWLKDEKGLLPLDMPRIRKTDFGFSTEQADIGLSKKECGVFAGKKVADMPGFYSIHDRMRDDFHKMRAARPARSHAERDALATRLAGVRLPAETGVETLTLGTLDCSGKKVSRLAFTYPDGFAVPAVLVEPAKITSAPCLMAGIQGRVALLDEAEKMLAAGAPVLLVDVSGTGDIGRRKFDFYGADDTPEEGVAVMLYLMGESLVGRRAGELLVAAEWLKARFGKPVNLFAEGSVAVAAAHALAAERRAFASLRLKDPPPAWSTFLERRGVPLPYRYTYCVNGALKDYDWMDLTND